MSVAKEQWRNLTKKIEPLPPQEELRPIIGDDVDKVWKPLAVDPKAINANPLAEFEPLDEEDVVPLHENRPTFPKRDRLHRMAEDILTWHEQSVFYFRAKVDLAALAFRDYDPDDKKRNMNRYMQLNILWQWEDMITREAGEGENTYCFFKYRFKLGNHKLRLQAAPMGPASLFDMRWVWRPSDHLHFTFHTRPATLDTETPLGYKFYFRNNLWETGTARQHTEVIVNVSWPSFRVALSHEFSQNCSSISVLQKVHPRLVLGFEAKYPRKLRLPQPVGFINPAPIFTAIIRYFSWRNLFALVTEFSHQYGALQLRASYVKDLSAVSHLHVFPRYERWIVGGALWSNFYPSSLINVYKASYMAVGYSYTNYWSGYNVKAVIDSELNMKTEMSTGWVKNVDVTLQLSAACGFDDPDSTIARPVAQDRLGWALGFTWFT